LNLSSTSYAVESLANALLLLHSSFHCHSS